MNAALSVTATIARFELRDIIRSRWLLGYGLFFVALTDVLLRFSGTRSGALLSIMSVVLFIVPLVTVVFATVYLYHIRDFAEFVATQPVRRRNLFAGLLLGVALPLIAVFVLGLLAPFMWHGMATGPERTALVALTVTGAVLTGIFVALAAAITVFVDDRLPGLGIAIGAWLVCTVLYDGLVLLAATLFADRPLETGLLAMMIANPVDISRVVLLMQFDVSALMGYTGAVFRKTLSTGTGLLIAVTALVLWIAAPISVAAWRFERRDF